MAKWCVIVLLIAQNVFANADLSLCDMCIRRGAKWCHKKTEMDRCTELSSDIGCPYEYIETLDNITKNVNGDLFKPMYAERTLFIADVNPLVTEIQYTSTVKRNITTSVAPKLDVTIGNTICSGTECIVEISAMPALDFCSFYEYVDVRIQVENFTEEAMIRFYVACSCPCTKKMDPMSKECTFHGNFTCGICSCENGWTGEKCDQSCFRGDHTQTNEMCLTEKNNKFEECHGNGYCACEVCKCYENLPGSQYFDPMEQCADVCTQTIQCSACLRNGTVGECYDCQQLTMVELNQTVVATEMDERRRKTWVHCKEYADECDFDYYAMKVDNHFYAMVNTSCNTHGNEGLVVGPASTKVPLIVGILGIVAVIATVGGILLWKHMSALPALPMSDPQYTNIDAEESRGENPLYKPPTSSFKNPTYGKW